MITLGGEIETPLQCAPVSGDELHYIITHDSGFAAGMSVNHESATSGSRMQSQNAARPPFLLLRRMHDLRHHGNNRLGSGIILPLPNAGGRAGAAGARRARKLAVARMLAITSQDVAKLEEKMS